MNVKKSAKKVFAIAAGLALVGTTVMGALAYDLSNYPAPFVENGMATGAIVVGANAATSDVLGAIDIAASLQAAAVTATPIASSSTVAVEGGKDYDVDLANKWPASELTLKENKLAGFTDETTIKVNGSDVDYFDELAISANATKVNRFESEDANGREYITVNKGDVVYKVYFKDDVTVADAKHTAKFKMLGQDVEAYGFNFAASTPQFSIVSSKDHAMTEGDTQTVAGHTVTLKRVGSGSVIVDVDGQTKIMNKDDAETFEDADDFYVKVNSIFYVEGSTDNVANLKLGTDSVETAKNGKSAEFFGQPSKLQEADWSWLVGNDSIGQYVGVKLNMDYSKLKITDADKQRAPLFLGDELALPNNYAALNFNSLAASYKDVTISLTKDLYLSDDSDAHLGDYNVIQFSADSDIFTIGSSDTAETVYAAYNESTGAYAGLWYENGDNTDYVNSASFGVKIDSESLTITPATDVSNSSKYTTTIVKGSDTLGFVVMNKTTEDKVFQYFGTKDDAEGIDLKYNGVNIGNDEYDYETAYGIKIANPNKQFDSGSSFVISIPSEQQYATVVVKSKGSVVSAGSNGGMSYSVNPIALGLGVLDTDAPALGSKPMIIVGGPVANTVAAEFMGNPTADVIAQTFEAGKALIKYDDAKKAMLVAGYDKQETLGASYVVADYKNPKYTFAGNEMSVVVTDLNNIEVTSVN